MSETKKRRDPAIILNEDYGIDVDIYEYKLMKKVGIGEKAVWNAVGHYGRMRILFTDLIDRLGRDALMSGEVKTLAGLCEAYDDAVEMIRRAIPDPEQYADKL